MVSLDKAVIARYKHAKKIFEVLVDPEKVDTVKAGGEVDMADVLAAEEIFEDVSKGDKATEGDLMTVFSTTDVEEIARRIIKEGEVQLTTEQRRKRVEEKRKMVINQIAQIAINPKTDTPHPPARIEIAMKEAKVHIDPFKTVDELVSETVKAIRPIIPIKIEETQIAIKIPAAYTGHVYDLKKKYKVTKEDWQGDGSYIALLGFPAGMREDVFSFLNMMTKGEVETRIVK
ncbi:MAG: ribosome assembly factor SBDS [Methanophagales archaeon]|jgi:ribosome maturation protein SDO1|nr:ribosome maturation protein SDO1 [Methanophagales archaeon]KAF5436391.1 ribosome maturation protein SDO1 [Methanophagales archaeon]MCK4732216.1 ribosome assembly factor SBDS [Methanophagales archaeon]